MHEIGVLLDAKAVHPGRSAFGHLMALAYAQPCSPRPTPRPPRTRLSELSDREREVLVAVGNGWTNAEIAHRFVLSESTVKKHVGRVLAKIGARDRIEAVIFAYDAGLARSKQ